jgi:hypothetical protein
VLQYHFNWKWLSAMAGVTWWNFYFRLFEEQDDLGTADGATCCATCLARCSSSGIGWARIAVGSFASSWPADGRLRLE